MRTACDQEVTERDDVYLQELRAAQVEHELGVQAEGVGQPEAGGVLLGEGPELGRQPDERAVDPELTCRNMQSKSKCETNFHISISLSLVSH